MTVGFDAIARRLAPALLLVWEHFPAVGLAEMRPRKTMLRFFNRFEAGRCPARAGYRRSSTPARSNAAEIELKNLLRDDPGLVDARLLLAQLYLRTWKKAPTR